jgi:hypothetical protein
MIYDFRILPFALGDIVISMIHGAIDLKNQPSKFPFYYYRNDLEKNHPIQSLINKPNAKRYLGDLNEALLFNPLGLRVKKLTKKSDNTGCETTQELAIQKFYREYVKSNRVKEYHNYFNSNIASHKSLNQWYAENNQIPQLQSPGSIARDTRNLIKQYTGKNKWICVHLRFRGLGIDEDLADVKRNADPEFWHEMLSRISREYKNDHAVLLLGPAGRYPASFNEITNLYAVSGMGGTLKNSIAAILFGTAFIGSSSGFANCATFSSTPYLIFDVSKGGYENYCIENDSSLLPFAKKQQYLSFQLEDPKMCAEKIRNLLPLLKSIRRSSGLSLEIKKANKKYKTISAFSHIISKHLNKLDVKPSNRLFSEICKLEEVVPELQEDAILKMIKSKSIQGLYKSEERVEEYLKKFRELSLKANEAKYKQIIQRQDILIRDAISLYDENWSSYAKDLDIRASRNLLSKLYFCGIETVNRNLFILLFQFWKYWYRLFYKPFGRYRI